MLERSLFGRRKAFAVYRLGASTFFSAGRRQWQLGHPALVFGHRLVLPFMSHFEMRETGRVVLSFTYTHVRRTLWAVLDPTYDGIDEDKDYFLAFLARNAGSAEWCAATREIWCDVSTG